MKILLLGLGNSPVRSKLIANHCENFIGDIHNHEILTFGYNDGVDIKIDIGDDLSQVFNKLPDDWSPDFCLFWEIEWNLLPEGMEHAPCPTVALMSDWDYDIHLSKYYAESFDLVIVIADFEKSALRAIGAKRVEVFDRAWALKEFTNDYPKEMRKRKYDIVYTTFIDDSLHPERSRWILKLCELSDKYNVLVENHMPGYQDYMDLLDNSRLVFSHHRFGSMSGRVMEAGSQGAVVLDTGMSTSKMLNQGQDYLRITNDNVTSQVDRALSGVEELQNISGRIHRKVSKGFEARGRFTKMLHFIQNHLKDAKGSHKADNKEENERLFKRGVIYYYSFFRISKGPFIVGDRKKLLLLSICRFEEAMAREPSARNRTNLAIVKATYGFLFDHEGFHDSGVDECIHILKETIEIYPTYVMAHYNLAVLYLRVGRLTDALQTLRAALGLYQDKQVDVDIWCLQNVDYEHFNDFLRKGINDNLFAYCSGVKGSSIKNIVNLHQAFILYLIATIEEKEGKVYAALEALLESEKLHPESRLTLSMLSQQLLMLGYKNEGIATYERAIELMPVNLDIRLKYIKVLYMYRLDDKLVEQIETSLRIVNTVSFYKDRKSEIVDTIETFTCLTQNRTYSYDLGRETILNDWLRLLTAYLHKDSKNIKLVLRIIEVLHALRRIDKAFELVKEYTDGYGDDLNHEELLILGNIYDYLKKAAHERNHYYSEKLNKIEDHLSCIHP